MDKIYTIELTGKQLRLLCNCIDERLNSNRMIASATKKNNSGENRSLKSLQRYFKNIKNNQKEISGTPS